MTPGRTKWPSVGFVAVCVTYALATVFFLWGVSTPELDRVWTLHHELKIGRMAKLKKDDRRLLDAAMKRHADLAEDLLDGLQIGLISAHDGGWIATPTAIALRTTQATAKAILFDVQTPLDLLPLTIVVRGAGWKEKLEIGEQGQQSVALPPAPAVPEIIEVKVKGRDLKDDPSVLGIRLRFPEAP